MQRKIPGKKKDLLQVWFVALMLLLVPVTLTASGYRFDDSIQCPNAMKLLQGHAEMILDEPHESCFPDRVNQVDKDMLLCIQKYIRGDQSTILKLQREYGCRHYIIKLDSSKVLAICHQHSGYSRNQDESISPYEVFSEFVTSHGYSPDRFNLELNKEPFSTMRGSYGMQLIARYWLLLMFLPLVFFVIIKSNIAESGMAVKIYVAGTCVVSFVFILSLVTLLYFGAPVIPFRVASMAGSHYPAALNHLSKFFLFAAPAWWLVSLIAVYPLRKTYITVPFTYAVFAPLLFITILLPGVILPMPAGEAISTILSLALIPGFGIFMSYLLGTSRYHPSEDI